MRDYAGFGYASLILVMYPLNLHEIMRDLVMPPCCFCYVSLDLVMPPCCFCYVSLDLVMPPCCFGYVSLDLVMFRLSLLFRLCSYSWLCIVYYIHDTILYKGYCL